MIQELESVCCPICDSKRYNPLFTGKDFLFSKKKFTVVKCESCGLIFTNPRVKENHISLYYFADYVSHTELKQSRIFQMFKNRYGNLFGDSHLKILQILKSADTKTVLEIGPGSGSLLSFLSENGIQVAGVEIDRNCVSNIRDKGILCHLGNINEVISEIGLTKYDAVILHHAFEHLYNPKEALKSIYSLLNKNGIIYLCLPNIDSIEAKLFRRYWKGLDLPRHIIHYDRKSIKRALSEANFEIINIDNDAFPSSFVESMGFFLFKGRMPSVIYSLFYKLWKLLGPIHVRLIGSGVMSVIARKR